MAQPTKTCRQCGETKPPGEFHRLTTAPDGRQYTCKQCRADKAKLTRPAARIRQARYREANRDTLRAKGQEYWADPAIKARAQQRYEANRDERIAWMRQYYATRRDQARASVFEHYGTSCSCCGRTDDLSIDHVNGGGSQHKRDLFGSPHITTEFYLWLIARGFPAGYQTLCRPCNSSKGTGDRCRMRHH